MIEIFEAPYDVCAVEIARLAVVHGREIAPHRGVMGDVDPDLSIYRRLADLGAVCFVTAREAGELVGYAVFAVMPHHHYRGALWAAGDGLWLAPEARRPRVAYRLLDVAEDSLRARGVVLIMIAAQPGYPALGRLLQRRRYQIASIGYSRRL